MFGFIFRPRFNCIDVIAVVTLSIVWTQSAWIAVCLYMLLTIVSAVGESMLASKQEGV